MTASQFQLKKLILHRTISCEGAEPSQEMEQMLVINGTNLQMQCWRNATSVSHLLKKQIQKFRIKNPTTWQLSLTFIYSPEKQTISINSDFCTPSYF